MEHLEKVVLPKIKGSQFDKSQTPIQRAHNRRAKDIFRDPLANNGSINIIDNATQKSRNAFNNFNTAAD